MMRKSFMPLVVGGGDPRHVELAEDAHLVTAFLQLLTEDRVVDRLAGRWRRQFEIAAVDHVAGRVAAVDMVDGRDSMFVVSWRG